MIGEEIKALANETEYRFSGMEAAVLSLCGFHIRATKPAWLDSAYDCLVTVQHYSEDEGTTVLLPMNLEDHEAWEFLWGHLLSTQERKLYVLGRVLPWVGGCHEPGVRCDPFQEAFDERGPKLRPRKTTSPEIEELRKLKEIAIDEQRFDEAADLRDLERTLLRELND